MDATAKYLNEEVAIVEDGVPSARTQLLRSLEPAHGGRGLSHRLTLQRDGLL